MLSGFRTALPPTTVSPVMQALARTAQGVALEERAVPLLERGDEVLIRVEMVGLCRTDLAVAAGKLETPVPLVLGHECSGTIVAVGKEVSSLRCGARVTVNPVLPCGNCLTCQRGLSTACPHAVMLGLHRDGALAEYLRVPAAAVHVLPDSLSFQEGAYMEPVAASLAVLKSGVRPEEEGVIYGDNRISALTARILAAAGFAHVRVHDPKQGQLEENSADFIVETLATDATFADIQRAIRPGGRIVLKSRQAQPVAVNIWGAVNKEITLSAVNYGDFAEAVTLTASGKLVLQDLLGDIFPLADWPAAFAAARAAESRKIFIQIAS